MMQRMAEQHIPEPLAYPRRRDVFFHAVKTSKLIGALLIDRRVPVLRKFLFLGSIAALLALLFFPDAFGEVVMNVVLPVVGTVLGVPLDAGFDWIAFALVVVGLLRVFPPELVSEHYRHIFA